MGSYNGWKNRQTWNLQLWAMNDEGSYRTVVSNRPYKPAKAMRIALDLWPNGTPDMDGVGDMDIVDWHEIAQAWNDCD